MSEPTYKIAHEYIERQKDKGLAKYGKLLDGTPNGRRPLKDLAEELTDALVYTVDAERQLDSLIEYVARLEAYKNKLKAALEDAIGGEPIDHDPEFKRIKYVEFQVRRDELEEYKALLADDPCATSPLSGQPQPAPATGWRPIAEAPNGEKLVVGRRLESKRWVTACLYKYEAVSMFYTHYHPISAPPQEGE